MSFWTDVLALSPTVMWMGDSSTTTETDDSGNSKDGTYSGTVYTQQESPIIANHPEAYSVYMDGTDVWIYRNDETALDVSANNFTAICTVQPQDLASQRDVIGKLDCWQIWLQTTGQITGHFTPAWTSITSSNDAAGKLTTTVSHLIAIRQDGSGAAEASVWIGHAGGGAMNKVATATKSSNLTNSASALRMGGSSTGSNRSFKGWMQGFAYWPSTALTDTQLSSLYTTWDTTPTPTTPDAPSITKPTGGSTFSNGMLVTVVDGADPGMYGTLEYKVEKNMAGAGWVTMIDWTTTRPVDYVVDVSAFTEGNLDLRAYARRSVSTVSAASATVSVTIDYDANIITTPTLVWEWSGTEILGAYGDAYVNGDPLAIGVSRWQIADSTAFTDCAIVGGALGSAMEWTQPAARYRFGMNTVQATAGGLHANNTLVDDTDYYIRVRYEDELSNVSAWSTAVKAKTAINKTMSLGGVYLLAEDQTANNDHAAHVFSDSTVGTPKAYSAQIFNQRMPYYRIKGSGTKLGVLCDNQEYIVNASAGPFAHASGTAPTWKVQLAGYLIHEAVGVGHGLFGLEDATGVARLYIYRKLSDSTVYMQWINNSGTPVSGGEISCGITIDANEEFDFTVEWDGSVLKCNTTTIYTPGTTPDLFQNIDEVIVGHHSKIGPTLAGGYHMMEGIWFGCDFWWNGSLVLNYDFTDPQAPDAPTLTRTA